MMELIMQQKKNKTGYWLKINNDHKSKTLLTLSLILIFSQLLWMQRTYECLE